MEERVWAILQDKQIMLDTVKLMQETRYNTSQHTWTDGSFDDQAVVKLFRLFYRTHPADSSCSNKDISNELPCLDHPPPPLSFTDAEKYSYYTQLSRYKLHNLSVTGKYTQKL